MISAETMADCGKKPGQLTAIIKLPKMEN